MIIRWNVSKKELESEGFTNYEVSRFNGATSTIKVKANEEDFDKIKKICQKVEFHFKRAN